jgi:hypothetical protein
MPTDVYLGGHRFEVFDYEADPSGFHGTAYIDRETSEIIVAYRGTDPDFKDHPLTVVRDIGADYTMIRDRFNPQEKAARDFTARVIDAAKENGISLDHATLVGHSLGGALVEIESSKFNLPGTTFNSYGAADLGYGVTEGGDRVINYVMAADPVSAASRHHGQVVVLARDQDVERLRAARYLDAPAESIAPNPLLAMDLGDHSVTWFTGPDSMLKPENMLQAKRNYAQSRPYIDHFRGDMYDSRADLELALNRTEYLNLESAYAHLSPRMRQQLLEYHAATVDPMIRGALEHNSVVEGVTHALDQGSAALRAGGEYLQQGGEQAARGFRSAGQAMQQQADEVSRIAGAGAPLDAVLAGGVAFWAKAAGYVAHAEAEGLARTSQLAGEITHATGQFAAGLGQRLKDGVEQGVHASASGAQSGVHQAEAILVRRIDSAIEDHARLGEMVDAVGQSYTDAKRTLSRGIDATERAAGEAYDTLSHPGRWFGQKPPASLPVAHLPSQAFPTDPPPPVEDPRHPGSANHALYNQLQRRIPEASEARLLQFAAECHAHEITAQDLRQIHFDRDGGHMVFQGAGMLATPVSVDVKMPSPPSQQSVQQIQQHDQQQAQMTGWVPSRNAAAHQGSTLAGP